MLGLGVKFRCFNEAQAARCVRDTVYDWVAESRHQGTGKQQFNNPIVEPNELGC